MPSHLRLPGLVVDANTAKTDLVECDFPGYAPSPAMDWSPAGLDDTGNVVVIGDVPAFQANGDPGGQLVTGIYLLGAGDEAPLIGVAALPAPLGVVDGELIPATVVLSLGNSSRLPAGSSRREGVCLI